METGAVGVGEKMKLPIFQSDVDKLTLMQTKWAALIEPTLSLPQVNSVLLQSVDLVSGSNIVNHKLGRRLVGWQVTRMRDAFSEIYDTQDSNTMPDLTLNLNSSVDVTVDLLVW